MSADGSRDWACDEPDDEFAERLTRALLYPEGAPRHARPEPVPSWWSRVVAFVSRLVLGGAS